MKKTSWILACMMISILFVQCKKDDGIFGSDSTAFNAHFWTTIQDPSGLKLYINDEYKGELRYLDYTPSCEKEEGKTAQPIVLTLKSGTYSIVAKDANGKVVLNDKLRFNKRRFESSGTAGGSECSVMGDCLNYRIFN